MNERADEGTKVIQSEVIIVEMNDGESFIKQTSDHPDWTDEGYLLSLPPDETEKFERKGTLLLDLSAGAKESEVRSELSKQLSAFANMGGGHIIYGLADDGSVDKGGVGQIIRGRQSTKEWLENVISELTDPEIIGAKVLSVFPKSEASMIETGKALYVVEVPDSDRAPHQSITDRRYYVRIGSRSEPAPHRIIEDIRNRAKHPNVEVLVATADFEIIGRDVPPNQTSVRIPFHISLRNVGILKSQNTCLHFQLDVLSASLLKFSGEGISHRADSNSGRSAYFWELLFPLYPEMKVDLVIDVEISVSLNHGTVNHLYPFWAATDTQIKIPVSLQSNLTDAKCKWALFADNAPPKRSERTLGSFSFNEKMIKMIERDRRAEEIKLLCFNHFGPFPS